MAAEEIVADGETRYLSEVKEPDQLAANIDAVLEMGDRKRERMGTRGRERIEETFGIDRIVEEWRTAIYSAVMG